MRILLAVVLMAASSAVSAVVLVTKSVSLPTPLDTSWVSWADHNGNGKAGVVIKSDDPLTLIDDLGRFLDMAPGRNQITFRNGALEYRGQGEGKATKIPFNAEKFKILFDGSTVGYTYLGGDNKRPVYDIGHSTVSGIRVIQDTPAVPIPAAAWLFGSALLGLAVVARRKRL